MYGEHARRNGIGVSKRKPFAASAAQRAKCAELACCVCGSVPVQPAHLIPRGMTTIGQDDPLAVVPLCGASGNGCHRAYDDGELDLSPYLEPRYRAEVAFAVERVGLFQALRRITNLRWLAMKENDVH